MSLVQSNLDKIAIKSIESFINSKNPKNIYFNTANLSGSGKSSLLKKIRDYCIKKDFSYLFVKNLCSLKGGIKKLNNSKQNLKIILDKIPNTPHIILCDEIKDPQFYLQLKEKHYFIYVGYNFRGDIGCFEDDFEIIQIDTQFSKKEREKILIQKYPNQKNIITKVIKIAPTLGIGEQCLIALNNGLKQSNLRDYCLKLNDSKIGKTESYPHYLCFEQGLQKEKKSFKKLL